MNDLTSELGPVIRQKTANNAEVHIVEKRPYQVQKELHRGTKYDIGVVFGAGPVKDVRFLSELTADEKTSWQKFKEAPRHQVEPEYYVIDDTSHGFDKVGVEKNPFNLDDIRNNNIPEEEKQVLVEARRQRWMNEGKFSTVRWGKFNAYAAGLSLYLDVTDKLLLTGGRTIPKAVRETADKQTWPSEAETMRDLIIRRFGKLMFKKDHPEMKDPSEVDYRTYLETELKPRLIIEDEAETTPENVVYSVNKNPDLFRPGSRIALISNEHQLPRATEFLRRFAGINEVGHISAQSLLLERASIRDKGNYKELMQFFTDETANQDLKKRSDVDREKVQRMQDPQRILYWFGYLGMLNDGSRAQAVISDLLKTEDVLTRQRFVNALSLSFAEAGLLYSNRPEDIGKQNNLYTEDLGELQKKDSTRYNQITESLTTLIVPAKRDIILNV
jgi:hypothetical protein